MIIKKEVKMKHTKFALGAALLILAFLLVGCPHAVNDQCTVTFVAGELNGTKPYYDDDWVKYSYTETITKGSKVTPKEPTLPFQNDTKYIFEFGYYSIEGSNEPFDFTKPIEKDTTFYAHYSVIAPDDFSVTSGGDGHSIKVTFSHPNYFIVDSDAGLRYSVTIFDGSTKIDEKTGEFEYKKEILFDNLEHGKKYTVKAKSTIGDQASETLEESLYATIKTVYLMLMYMDGDNNLNDPLFLDLNEVEYGLSQASEEQQAKLTVLALWDGASANDSYSPTLGYSGSKLFKIGPDSGELFTGSGDEIAYSQAAQTLSSNTIDFTSKASWLAGGEVNMSNKETLRNFLNFATQYYSADYKILQFSNHGGGPRSSYFPKTAKLPNGKKIKLHDYYGRRAMCWDDTSGGESFLKTADVSSVLTDLGFTDDNDFYLIIEDVCLGASIEEAYELKDNAQYLLASPNTTPAAGLDYTVFIESLLTTQPGSYSSGASYPIYHAAIEVCEKYVKDYAIPKTAWDEYYETVLLNIFLSQPGYEEIHLEEDGSLPADFPTDDFNTFKGSLTNEDIISIKTQLSMSEDLNTISFLAIAAYADDIKNDLNNIVSQILTYGNMTCTKYFYDQDKDSLTDDSTKQRISRSDALKELCLRPYDPIVYQGTYSWLYDIGTVAVRMYSFANAEGWTGLKNAANTLTGHLHSMTSYTWRDGFDGTPTYSTRSFVNAPSLYRYGWLVGNSSDYCHFGLTISGETFKVMIENGQATVVNGDDPSWYSELAFGKDCKWNSLLQKWF